MQSSSNSSNDKLGGDGLCLCDGTSDACESGVSMNCRCRKLPLLALILSLVFFLCNVSLVIQLTTGEPYRDLSPSLLLDMPSSSAENKNSSSISFVVKTMEHDDTPGAVMSDKGAKKEEEPTSKQQKARKRHQQQQRNRRNNKPVVQPQAASLSPNATLAACLLIKDDNSILSEWIAYHYHTVRLRHLVVAVDPSSQESPHDILETWRPYLHDVTEWHDADYNFTPGQVPPQYRPENQDEEISTHRYRQRVFLAQCLRTLRQSGRQSWVMHIDTDEFVVPSKLLRQMEPDYVTLAPMEEPGSVLNLIQQVVRKTGDLVSYPCISMLRVLFGSVESTDDERNDQVPAQFNAMAFESLRWRYHGLPHNMAVNGNPKVLLDLSAIPDQYLERDEVVYSIHRPVREFCPKNKDLKFSNYREQPIAVQHYLGSWERYSRRNDKRRSRSVYEQKAMANRGKDDGVRPWLQGFVQTMGLDVASKLLGDSYLLLPKSTASLEPKKQRKEEGESTPVETTTS